MPRVEFDVLPDAARVWVFGAAAPIVGTASEHLLHAVDQHLAQWRAHGAPLVCGRAWRDDQFLVVAVDEAATNATGCSIDGMFRVLASMESQVGTSLVGGGSVFWRDPDGAVHATDRSAFRAAAARGDITADTHVFDTTVTTLGNWRSHFERPARDSWHARLI
jgi:hypothetical protein